MPLSPPSPSRPLFQADLYPPQHHHLTLLPPLARFAYGLFFDKERVTAWVSINAYPWDLNVTRVQKVGVWFDSADIAESLIGNILNRGSGGADPMVPMHSKGYVTTSGAGKKIIKGRYKTYSGYLAFLYTASSSAPVQTGFEIQH